MSTRIGVAELRLKLASVLDAAQRGDVYLVTRTGRDVAVIGPASGAVSGLAREATDCLRDLRDAQAERDRWAGEAARLRAVTEDQAEEIQNLREQITPSRKRWGR